MQMGKLEKELFKVVVVGRKGFCLKLFFVTGVPIGECREYASPRRVAEDLEQFVKGGLRFDFGCLRNH